VDSDAGFAGVMTASKPVAGIGKQEAGRWKRGAHGRVEDAGESGRGDVSWRKQEVELDEELRAHLEMACGRKPAARDAGG